MTTISKPQNTKPYLAMLICSADTTLVNPSNLPVAFTLTPPLAPKSRTCFQLGSIPGEPGTNCPDQCGDCPLACLVVPPLGTCPERFTNESWQRTHSDSSKELCYYESNCLPHIHSVFFFFSSSSSSSSPSPSSSFSSSPPPSSPPPSPRPLLLLFLLLSSSSPPSPSSPRPPPPPPPPPPPLIAL